MLDFLILSDSNASDGEMTVFLFVMTSFRRDTVIRCAIQIRQTNASFFYLIFSSLSFPLKLRVINNGKEGAGGTRLDVSVFLRAFV